ncbi:DUF4190 domain-containing protein [Microbacterium sp. JB110]|nr:DUF4190 domain-containing protein [Microbacterium sp. JB110]SJM68995.1 Proline-rich antigen [Frigoribacterium sp. JB110]
MTNEQHGGEVRRVPDADLPDLPPMPEPPPMPPLPFETAHGDVAPSPSEPAPAAHEAAAGNDDAVAFAVPGYGQPLSPPPFGEPRPPADGVPPVAGGELAQQPPFGQPVAPLPPYAQPYAGPQSYAGPYAPQAMKRANGLATAGFVVGLVSIFLPLFFGFIGGVVGIVLSIVGVVKHDPATQSNKGLGIAGIVLSAVAIIFIL